MDVEVVFHPSGKIAKVRRGATVLEAARRAGVSIATRCGGKASCFMCKVKIVPGSDLLPMGEVERRKLSGLQDDGVRLSCQAKVNGRTEVELPPDPLKAAIAKQLARQQEEDLW